MSKLANANVEACAHTNQHIWSSFRIYSHHYHTKLIMEMAEGMSCGGIRNKKTSKVVGGVMVPICAVQQSLSLKNSAHVHQILF